MPELGCLYRCGECGVETCENCPAYCETCRRSEECEEHNMKVAMAGTFVPADGLSHDN